MNWQPIKTFIAQAFSENGSPSSARVISAWLCVSSMALIWFCVRHAMGLEKDAAMVWVGGLPNIILALAAFTAAPYGIAKAGQAAMAIWKKKDDSTPSQE
jgi:hypothetical protein